MSKEQEIRDAILAGILPDDFDQRDLSLGSALDHAIIDTILNVTHQGVMLKADLEEIEELNEPAAMSHFLVTAVAALTIRCGKLDEMNDKSIEEAGDLYRDKFVELVKINLGWVKLQRDRHEKETDPEASNDE